MRIPRPHGAQLIAIAALGLSMVTGSVARADVAIGVAAPLTGSDAVYGLQLRAGVDQAVADLNAAGGLLGQHVSVVLGDDLGDPKRGETVATSFAQKKIAFVVGPFSSGVALPASAIYGAAGIVEFVPAATAPQLTERGLPTIFRLGGREDQQGAIAAQFLLNRHETKVAILHDRTTAGKALADSVRKSLAAGGLKDVLYASIDKGDKDFGPLVARLKASGAHVAFWGGTQTEAGLLARQIHDAGLATVLMGGTGIASEDFATLAGPGAEGTLMVFPKDPRSRPEAAELSKRLTAQGGDPAAYVFSAYAAVQVLQQAADAARSLDPSAIAATIHGGTVFKTVLGSLTFDAKGDVMPIDFTVLVWRKGPTGRIGF